MSILFLRHDVFVRPQIITQCFAQVKSQRVVLLVWLALLTAGNVRAEPEVVVKTDYYPVKVTSVARMQQQVNQASPLREGSKIYHGYTDSRVSWSWWWQTEEGACRIVRVESKVNIKYTLPRLVADPQDFQVRGIWSQWYWALKQHEHNHGRHAVDIARQGKQEILAMPPRDSCTDLDRAASALAAALIELLQARDEDYDRRTRHGETEAAKLSNYF